MDCKAMADKSDTPLTESNDRTEENLTIFDFDSKPNNAIWFSKNQGMRKLADGVLSYLCSVYNLKDGWCRSHDHSQGPRFVFNERCDGSTVRIHLAQTHLTIYISGPKSWEKAYGAKEFKGQRPHPTADVPIHYKVVFTVNEPADLEEVERFLLKVNINNFNPVKLALWKDEALGWDKFNDQLSTSTYAAQSAQRLIEWHEKQLGNRFACWLKNCHLDVSEVVRENPIEKKTREEADFTFKLQGKPVLAELKSVRNYKHSVKSCIRKATGQLLEYGLYNEDKGFTELWIVVDGIPEPADIEYIERLRTKFGIQYRLYYLEGNEFTLAC